MPGWDVVVCAVVEDLFGEFRLFEGYEVFDELDCGNTVSLTTIIQLRFVACTRQVSRQPFLIKVLRSSGDRWRMLWWDSVEVQGFQDALCQELCWYHRQVTACTRFCTLSSHSLQYYNFLCGSFHSAFALSCHRLTILLQSQCEAWMHIVTNMLRNYATRFAAWLCNTNMLRNYATLMCCVITHHQCAAWSCNTNMLCNYATSICCVITQQWYAV